MCYTAAVQTSFYASGFLYSLKTHQILLLCSEQTWSMLGGESNEGEEAEATFARIVNKLLNISLKEKNIHPVYDYFHDEKDKINYVFYAEVKKPQEFDCLEKDAYCWVAFKETPKLPFAAHSKQDVIVGERVINAKWREDEAKKFPLLSSPLL